MRHKVFLRLPAALLAAALFFLAGCAPAGPARHTQSWYQYFDTVSTVIGYAADDESFAGACAVVEGVLRDYHRLCDIYHDYEGMNNLKTVNDSAGVSPVAVDSRLLDVVEFALSMARETGGKCNVAMGAVLSLWHDCRETALNGGAAALPADEALRAAAEHCRIGDVRINREAGTLYLADGEMSLDLGAVAKGYAAEQAALALEAAGYAGYALSLGGNVRVIGTKPDGEPWVAGIQDPDDASESAYILRVSLTDASLVTSGSYQRYYEVDGKRYHHIIDPDTLYPRDEFVSVSIRTANSARADALSTAVFNMTLEAGLAFIEARADTEACWILADGTIRYSSGFGQYVVS